MKIKSAVAVLSLAVTASIHAGQYFQDFSSSAVGATNFSDGSQLFSTSYSVAQVVFPPYNELQLTANGVPSVYSAYELPDLDSGAPVYAFSAKWNMPVYGNFPNSADGFSFNFGQLSSLNLATNTSLESGYGVGLSFDIQTYSGNNPGFYIRVGTNIVASSPYNPQIQWGVNNDTRHFFEVDWNYYTGMTVRMDGTNTIFSNVITTNFFPQGGDRFVFAARCGASSEFIRLDNIAVVTGGNLVQLPSASPYYANNDLGSARTNAFDGDNSTYWGATGVLPAYVGATFLPTNSVALYTVTSANTGSRNADPQTFTLNGSSNGGGNWTTVGSGANCYFQLPKETHSFLVTNAAGFGAYRLNVTATAQAGSGCSVGELRLYALSKVAAPYATWNQTSAPNAPWSGVAISADGRKLAATTADRLPVDAGRIYLSTNGGKTWALSTAPTNNPWNGVASSADGTKLIASQWFNIGHVYLSTNSGATWTLNSSYPQGAGGTVASSADGTKLAVAHATWGVYTSTNSGATWTFSASGLPTGGSGNWTSIASSADGTRLFVGASFGNVYYSTNSGATWIQTSATGNNWTSLTCSSNGMRVTAIALAGFNPGLQYVSTDGGASWSYTGLVPWWYYTSSNDGNSSLATDKSHLFTLSPFNGDTPPATSLGMKLLGNYPTLSWPATNGGNFALQQSSSLSAPNWTNVFWPVVISGTNYQITTPSASPSAFFRLKTR